MKDLLHGAIPLLRAGGEHRKLVIAPIQRYIPQRCCIDPEHNTNFSDPDYAATMVSKLAGIREQIRGFIYIENLKHFRVCSGEKLLGWEDGIPGSPIRSM